jgi:hypothetical protein
MTKLERLKRGARESAQWRGHDMSRYENYAYGKGAYASCRNCGKGIFVDTDPIPNCAEITGSAVAVNCTKGKRQ